MYFPFFTLTDISQYNYIASPRQHFYDQFFMDCFHKKLICSTLYRSHVNSITNHTCCSKNRAINIRMSKKVAVVTIVDEESGLVDQNKDYYMIIGTEKIKKNWCGCIFFYSIVSILFTIFLIMVCGIGLFMLFAIYEVLKAMFG
jgi:hypothetical protein